MGKQMRQTLTPKGVADQYSIPESTLANLRWAKQGPRYYKVGRRVLYRVIDIEVWLFGERESA